MGRGDGSNDAGSWPALLSQKASFCGCHQTPASVGLECDSGFERFTGCGAFSIHHSGELQGVKKASNYRQIV